MPVTLNQDTLLTVKEVAEILKVPASWVYEHTRADSPGPLPHIKVGKYLRFFDADIRRYLEAIRVRNPRRY